MARAFFQQINPAFAKGHSRQGAALFRLGRFKEAAASYEAGLALEPANAEIKKALAEAQKAEAEHRPVGIGEARPKLQAYLARNALAARLALPRMVILVAAVRVLFLPRHPSSSTREGGVETMGDGRTNKLLPHHPRSHCAPP